MQSKPMRILVLISFIILIGCGRGNNGAVPTDGEVEVFYKSNVVKLTSFVQFCADHKSVKWVGQNLHDIDIALHDNDAVPEETLKQLHRKMQELEVESFSCSRNWSERGHPLISVTIPLYTIGLSVSGSSKGLKYLTENAQSVQSRVDTGELRAIGDGGWYIFLTN